MEQKDGIRDDEREQLLRLVLPSVEESFVGALESVLDPIVAVLDALPAAASDSFAGVGYVFDIVLRCRHETPMET